MAIAVMATMSIALILAVAGAKQWVVRTASSPSASAVGAVGDGDDVEQATPQRLLPKVIASLRNDSIFDLLTNFVIFSASIFYMLGVLAVIVLRYRRPDSDRPYKTWGYPIVPLAFLAVYVWFMMQVYRTNPLEAQAGIAFIALGVPVYYAYRRFSRQTDLVE